MDLLNKNINSGKDGFPTTQLIDDTIHIKDFSAEKLSKDSLNVLYRFLLKTFNNRIKYVKLDLMKVDSKDIYALAFIDSCESFCKSNSIQLITSGASKDLNETLDKIGFGKRDSEAKKDHRADSAFTYVGEATIKIIDRMKQLLEFVGGLALSIVYSMSHPNKIQWKETLYYMDKSGADAVPIVILICFLMGAILAFQGVVQMGRFGLSIYVANLVGLAIVKELGALMVAMICIGRAGSAYASEIGAMKVSEEIDAMKVMGLDIGRFLIIPKMIALVCVMPLLTVIGDIAGVFGGMVVGVLKSGVTANEYYLRTVQAISYTNLLEGVMKSIVFAILIAIIGCLMGLEAGNDAKGVGKAATSAVVTGIFFIVVADAIITALMN